MPIIGENVYYTRVRQTVSGKSCWINLLYAPLVEAAYASALTFATAWADAFATNFLACISEDARLEDVSVIRRGPQGFNQAQVVIAQPGTVADQHLPVWDTASFIKYPSNLAIEGATPTPFEMGRFCISGIPEAFQENGNFIPAAIATLDGLAGIIDTVTVGADDYQMYMQRAANLNVPPTAATFVLNCALNRVGTQLTRKG